jgi:ribosomal protein S6
VNKYEGLFILNTAGKEEGVKDIIDKVSAELAAAGCKVETVQKMDKRAFARVAEHKSSSGFFVNYIFEAEPAVAATLIHRFALNDDVFRIQITHAPVVKPAEPAA